MIKNLFETIKEMQKIVDDTKKSADKYRAEAEGISGAPQVAKELADKYQDRYIATKFAKDVMEMIFMGDAETTRKIASMIRAFGYDR